MKHSEDINIKYSDAFHMKITKHISIAVTTSLTTLNILCNEASCDAIDSIDGATTVTFY